MLNMRTHIGRVASLFALAFVAVLLLGTCSTGCANARGWFTVHDTTTFERVVTHRDTTVWVKADSAHIKLVTDLIAFRKLIEQLKENGPRTVHGSRNASLTMSVVNDSLVLDAKCDSVAERLQDALTTIQDKSREVETLTQTVKTKDAEAKGTMPGWMKGTSLLIGVCVVALFALFLLYQLVTKYLLKRV